MKTTDSQTTPAPPRLIPTLVSGFDTVTRHIALILFPIGLDLLIWLTPHLRLQELIDVMINEVFSLSASAASDTETTAIFQTAREMWTFMAEQFNLTIALRSYPVGIPSLMTSILPLKSPLGTPAEVEINSFGLAVLLFLGLTFLGLIAGTLYFSVTAQASLTDEVHWLKTFAEWPQTSLQIIFLALAWAALFIGISIPASCAISVVFLSGVSLGQTVHLHP